MESTIKRASFAFILNLVEFQGTLPFEIIPQHFLARATEEQIDVIQRTLRNFGLDPFTLGYEADFEIRGNSVHGRRIAPKDGHYWVINCETNSEIGRLQYALNLPEVDFEIGFTLVAAPGGGYGTVYRASSLFQYVCDPFVEILPGPVNLVSTAVLASTADIYAKLKNIESSHPDIFRAMREFDMLRTLPRRSRFATLGHFIVMELVITHKPGERETGDSLTRQVKSKMPLLMKRGRALNPEQYFGNVSEEKLWTKLYEYRSNLAHGGVPDFKKELAVLKDDDSVGRFMHEAVKLVLVQALTEPTLITDLRAC